MAKKKTTEEVRDDLASSLAESLNKKFKDVGHKIAYFIDTEKDNPTNIKDWISTGSDILDLAISNRPNGGMPVGRIVEITGLEGSGKSLMCAHIIAETQRRGGIGIYIDTEHAMDESFMTAIGVDFSKLLYIPMSKLEDIFNTVDIVITKIRADHKDKPVTIVIDSIMGAKTEQEDSADYTKDGYATGKAIILSKAMRKITELISYEKILFVCTNQLRTILNAMAFAEKYTTSGGKALGFHSSVRLRLSAVGKIKADVNGVDTVVGMKTKVVVTKNRMGPPHKVINFDIYFDSGIDNYGGWLGVLKAYKIVSQGGAYYTYQPAVGDEVRFMQKDFVQLITDRPEIKQELYDKICENYIMKYDQAVHGTDSIKIVGMNDESDEIETANQLDGGVVTDENDG